MNSQHDQVIAVDAAVPAEVSELDKRQRREKIYTRAIEGYFQRLRLYTGWPLLLGYFLLPWLNLDGRQAVLFDLPEAYPLVMHSNDSVSLSAADELLER